MFILNSKHCSKLLILFNNIEKNPCLSCDKAYVEDIWYEWCCDEKKCPRNAESEE